MSLLAAERLSKKFNDQVILDEVSFTINPGDRIALVGKNGIGKTTLLEILAGKQETDTGVINKAKACHIDYVEQEKTEYLDLSLHEFVADARRDLLDLHRQITELEIYLTYSPNDTAAVDKLGLLHHRFEREGGFDFENEIKLILHGLGFEEARFDDRLRNFSGGEKNRAGLARILAGRGNLLLLDEPTNHLDIESTTWLEQYLASLGRACIIVSHDRAFLSAAADQVWELAFGKFDTYTGGFERYIKERVDRKRLALHHYKHQQEEIKRIEEFVRRNMAGQKTKQAQSKLKYLNRIKRLPPPKADASGPAIKLQSSGRSFMHVLAVEDVTLAYGTDVVLQDVDFDVYRGEKIGIIGRNGSGKSTLLKSLLGELEPIDGSIRLGTNVDVAYFDQELSDLNLEATALDNLWELDPVADAHTMRSFLGRFGFSGEDAFKLVGTLSGGEKTKLCLAKLLYHPANFVILDEPTNHLDIYAREALEIALREYEGCCLIVSHDRYFLNEVVDKILYVHDGRVTMYNGNYKYFVEKTTELPAPVSKGKSEKQKQAFDDFKEQSKRKTRQKKELTSMRSRISDMERELEQLDHDINGGIPTHDWERLHAAAGRKREVEEALLTLYAEVERMEAAQSD